MTVTSSFTPKDILGHMEIEPRPGLFILGSRERRVTFYAQQVRALNLIYALMEGGRIEPGDAIAVIGGGIAGVTAAAGAALKGLDVTLLEKNSELLHLQTNCAKRWIHPRIYDWPDTDALRDDTNDLGVLPWKAGLAQDVIRQIRGGWDALVADSRLKLHCEMSIHSLKLTPDADGWKLRWEPKLSSKRFKVIILAVGFGLEKGLSPIPAHSYWEDDSLDQSEKHGARTYLISGVGDGGLTDVLRASLHAFRHDLFVQELGLDPRTNPKARTLAERLQHIEKEAANAGQKSSELITDRYRELEGLSSFVDEALKKRVRKDRTVVLNGPTESPLTLESSMLNRYLVSRLVFQGAITYQEGTILEGGILPEGKRWKVTAGSEALGVFDEVIIRHGTDPALVGLIPGMDLWKESESLRHKNLLDQSRRPHPGWYGREWFVGSAGGVVSEAMDEVAQYRLENSRVLIPFKPKGDRLVGRADVLEKVHRQLKSGRPTVIGQAAVFQGLGGLGKTQMAVEYAHRYQHEYPNGVYWLNADQDLEAQLTQLAVEARWVSPASEHRYKLEMALHRLRTFSDCLIIFDNLERIEAIRPYLPEGSANPHLLATSRQEQPEFADVPLDPLPLDESLTLLFQEAGREPGTVTERSAAELIAGQLAGLPLALELAGAYLRRRPIGWDEYLTLLNAGLTHALAGKFLSSFTRHEADLYATLRISETLVEESPVLGQVLELLTWSGAAAMGTSLMAFLLEVKEALLLDALGLGVTLRLLSRDEGGTGARYRLHRLVQRVWREQQSLDDRESWGRATCKRLGLWFRERRSNFAQLPEFEAEMDHLRQWENNAAARRWSEARELLWLHGYPPYHRGRYPEARDWVERALQLVSAPEDPAFEADLWNDLGSIYEGMGEYRRALEYGEKALTIRRRVLGEEHPDTASSYNNVGSTVGALGDHRRALEYQEKALAIRRRVLGEEHPDTAASYNNVGAALKDLDDRRRALEYQEKALSIGRRVLGEEHPDTATSYNNVGSTLGALGDHELALEYQKKDLSISRHVLGEEHPDTATSYNNVGSTLGKLGDHRRALEHIEKALSIRRRVLGDSHPGTLGTLRNLVITLHKLNRKHEAFQLIQRFLSTLPQGHPQYKELLQLAKQVTPPGFRPPSAPAPKAANHKSKKQRR